MSVRRSSSRLRHLPKIEYIEDDNEENNVKAEIKTEVKEEVKTIYIKKEEQQQREIKPKKKSSRVKTRVAMIDFLAKEPKNWERVYDKIKQYRKEHEAPVDTMGCATLADVNASEKVSLFKKKKKKKKTCY
jgi:endonuclease-3